MRYERATGPVVDVATRRALIVSATVVYGIYAGVHAAAVAGGDVPLLHAVALVGCAVAPFVEGAVRRRIAAARGEGRVAFVASALIVALPFFLLVAPSEGIGYVAPALAFAQGFLLVRARDPRFAAGALFVGPVYVLLEMTVHPSGGWLAAFALSVVLSVVGLAFLQRRESRAWFERRSPALLRRVRVSDEGARSDSSLRLAAYTFVVGVLVLLVAPAIYLPLILLPDPDLASSERGPTPEFTPFDGATARSPDAGKVEVRMQDDLGRLFPEHLELGGGMSSLETRLVMEIEPLPHADLGPLYLRGVVLDTITNDGASFSGRSERFLLVDADDGDRDGWCLVDTPPTSAPAREVAVRQHVLRIDGGETSIVFAPRPLLGITTDSLLYSPDGLTFVSAARDVEWIEHRLRIAQPPPLPSRARRNGDPRYLQLPEASPALDTVRRIAEEVVRGASDDRERVERVLAFFQDEFEYSLDADRFPGLDGVAAFLETRQGHCSYYAAASLLMLRTVGIPSRIATGFLANGPNPETGIYEVTTKNGHAWIEVEFRGVGWIPLDATPATGIARANERGLGDWLASLFSSLDDWAETGERGSLRSFASTLLDGPGALVATIARHPFATALVVTALVLAVVLRRRARRADPGRRARRDSRAAPSRTAFELLLDALARLGHRRTPNQTPLEFAAVVTRTGNDVLVPVTKWTRRFYEERYGAQPMSGDEVSELTRYAAAIRALSEPT